MNTIPITSEPMMNQTDGSMKSPKATFAGRMSSRAWTTPMAMAVTPMGTTSKTHQTRARPKRAIEALPSRVRAKRLARRVDRVRPRGRQLDGHQQPEAEEDEEDAAPVDLAVPAGRDGRAPASGEGRARG